MRNPQAPAVKPKKKTRRTYGQEIVHRFLKNKGAVIGVIIIAAMLLTAVLCPLFLDYKADIIKNHVSERLQAPSAAHWFGTDAMGRDLFVRVLWGTRISLTIGIAATMVSLLVGVFLGAVAGYYTGSLLETLIMRLTDVLTAIPGILLAMVIVAIFGKGVLQITIACSIMNLSAFIRVTRSAVLSVGGQEFVEASRAIGKTDLGTLFGHVIPNALSPIIVEVTLDIASAILCVSALSYLGIGIPSPAPEWGGMLSDARSCMATHPHMMLPGFFVLLAVLAFNLMGDGLRSALDPKQKR